MTKENFIEKIVELGLTREDDSNYCIDITRELYLFVYIDDKIIDFYLSDEDVTLLKPIKNKTYGDKFVSLRSQRSSSGFIIESGTILTFHSKSVIGVGYNEVIRSVEYGESCNWYYRFVELYKPQTLLCPNYLRILNVSNWR